MGLKIKGSLAPIQGQMKAGDALPVAPSYYYMDTFDLTSPGGGTYGEGDTLVTNMPHTPGNVPLTDINNSDTSSKRTIYSTETVNETRLRWSYPSNTGYRADNTVFDENGRIIFVFVHHPYLYARNWVNYRQTNDVLTTSDTDVTYYGYSGIQQWELRINHTTGSYELYLDDVLDWSATGIALPGLKLTMKIGEWSNTKHSVKLHSDPN